MPTKEELTAENDNLREIVARKDEEVAGLLSEMVKLRDVLQIEKTYSKTWKDDFDEAIQRLEEEQSVKSKLGKAVCAVMKAAGNIPKTGKADPRMGGYSYSSDVDLLTVLQPLMAEHGLSLYPVDMTVNRERYVDKQGSEKGFLATVLVKYTLKHVSGEEQTVYTVGQGWDSMDKAVYKAMTGAFKYAMREVFAIPTGDDPEKGVEDVSKFQSNRVHATPPVQQQPKNEGRAVNRWDYLIGAGRDAMNNLGWPGEEVAELMRSYGAQNFEGKDRVNPRSMPAENIDACIDHLGTPYEELGAS